MGTKMRNKVREKENKKNNTFLAVLNDSHEQRKKNIFILRAPPLICSSSVICIAFAKFF